MTAPTGNVLFIANPKAVYDEKDYGFKYGNKWLASGETISASAWAVYDAATDIASAEVTIITSAVVDANKTAQVWLKDGIAGKTYKVVNQITTTGGRKVELAFLLPVV